MPARTQRMMDAFTVGDRPVSRFGLMMMIALALSAASGCSQWTTASMDSSLLQKPRMSPDTVVIELAFVDISPADDLWEHVDEQHLSIELRRRLAQQGLRSGVTGAQLPGWISDRLEQQQKMLELDKETGTAVVAEMDGPRRLQCRSAQPREIEVGSVREQIVLNVEDCDQTGERAFDQARCRLSLITRAQGDGRVQLQVTPEITHGTPRHRWVGSDGSFRFHLSQDYQRYDDLTIHAVLSPGQTLVLTGTGESQGIGQHFFPTGERIADHRPVLLLRLAQTQLDDLFSPQPTFTPIATDGL